MGIYKFKYYQYLLIGETWQVEEGRVNIMKGAYSCSYHSVKAVVEEAANEDEARRIFVKYLETHRKMFVSPEAVSAEWTTMITTERGFVEVV